MASNTAIIHYHNRLVNTTCLTHIFNTCMKQLEHYGSISLNTSTFTLILQKYFNLFLLYKYSTLESIMYMHLHIAKLKVK